MKRWATLAMVLVGGCGGGGGPAQTPTAVPTALPSVTATAPATSTATSPVSQPTLSPGVLAGGLTWGATAGSFGSQEGTQLLFQCPPDGTASSVWGTDVYTADSSVCTAAVHVGLIDFSGGSVIIEIRPGQQSYAGSERNGVTSRDYGSWGSSFAFVDAAVPTATSTPSASPTLAPSQSAAHTPAATNAGSGYAELLTHIPPVIRNTCTEIDPTASAALAVANCEPEDEIIDPDVVIDDIVYVMFDTLAGATQKYALQLETIGDQFGEDCRTGPSQVAYTVDGEVHGRLLCAPDEVYGAEVVAWWYDDRLNIVGSVLLFEGGYEGLSNIVELATALP